jgi:membrane protein YqaA with SNARE-associated domain
VTLLTLWLTTFVVCLIGSVIPLVNTEIYLLSVSALSPMEFMGPLVIAAAFGQMVGKVGMFYAGRGLLRIRSEKVRSRVIAVRDRMEARPKLAKVTLFASATIGLPPLYVVSIACGTIGMGVLSFFTIGSVGRLIHFAVVAYLPQFAKLWMG